MSDAAWKRAPATCSGRRRVRGKTAQASSCCSLASSAARVETERLGGGDHADQTMQVIAVGGEVVGERDEGRVDLGGGGQVVDRLDQRAAEQEGPDAVDRRAGEVRVSRCP